VRFLIDSMLPPEVADRLRASGHEAVTPADLGAHNLPDGVLITIAAADGRVIVTENASDFAHVTTCTVLFVRKSWWPAERLGPELAAALSRWADVYRDPGPWPHWMPAEIRQRG
jgi:uncharacterized protein with PIN domain